MINNGIINIGDNNINTITNDIDYDKVSKELKTLLEHYKDETIEDALTYSKNKDEKKLINCLKKLSKEVLKMIKHLSLTTLEKLIEKNLF
ncbi:MAG TPA: hypothetical protein IAB59_05695 [Candidatus Onthousia faecipullorum]|uniref:Uncharacterized protein n=1 Tax=Candidatus Onthousia faecipullorum TaxID=2840887 RepID=A0A9D1GBH1_9FIRM|nr:hypothetical protein [Candidatus Onthousia faecipullorum]